MATSKAAEAFALAGSTRRAPAGAQRPWVWEWRLARACQRGGLRSCGSALRKAVQLVLLVCVYVAAPVAGQDLWSEMQEFNWAYPEAMHRYLRRLGVILPNTSSAQERNLQGFPGADSLRYLGLDWTPPQKKPPPGGGPAALFAGTNYTSFVLHSKEATTNTGRVVMVIPTMNPSAAIAGHCMVREYGFPFSLPPLDGSQSFQGHRWDAPPKKPIKFSQGGIFKLCWTEAGNFGIGDGWIIPRSTTSFRVFGALDSCEMRPDCLMTRRFFCMQIHQLYAFYLPTGSECWVFIQASYGPLLYSRLTWAVGKTCQTPVGENMVDGQNYYPHPDEPWVRTVNPLSLIYLGYTRRDQRKGFNYRLCFCPGFDNKKDGACGAYDDFAQQVGSLTGIMASYLNIASVETIQVIVITRFTIKVDCGDGPHCATNGLERVKLVHREWDPYMFPSEDGVFWNTSTTCHEQLEVPAWYSPLNCANTTHKLTGQCKMGGGTDRSNKIFGKDEVRILPKIEADRPWAQIFQLCFVHNPSENVGTPAALWNPKDDDAMQNDTRTFWKIAELVVEPLWLYGPEKYIMSKTVTVRVAPPNLTQSNTLHGHPKFGPILKVLEENRRQKRWMDAKRCALTMPSERDIEGIICTKPSDCQPRANKIGNELQLPGLIVKRAGVFAICYCEKWYNEAGACVDPAHWTIVGKVQVAGPLGSEEWILDTNMIQSLHITGFGFTDHDNFRILEEGQFCNEQGYNHTESSICIFRKGKCMYHGSKNNNTHIADIVGLLRRWNSTDPPAVIQSITPYTPPYSLVNFAEVPVLELEDIIKFEDNIYSTSPHWARLRDLNRNIRGEHDGHEVIDLMNAGKSAMIRFNMDPYPPIFTSSQTGRWWRTTKSKMLWLKARKEKSQLPVCWGPGNGEYLTWAGYVNVLNPAYMPRLVVGLTTTAAGSTAPVMLSFWTGKNPLYGEPRNPTHLRITFMDNSILSLAEAGVAAGPLGPIGRADQMHEASQAVCGQLMVEMWADSSLGFPVPRGCYWDYNRFDSNTKMRSIFILFESLNGLTASTKYTIVMNMHLHKEMSMDDYAKLDDPLIEVAALDDVVIKPEGVIEIGWVNPDKAIVTSGDVTKGGPRLFNVSHNHTIGPSINRLVDSFGMVLKDPRPPILYISADAKREFGFSFPLRGDETAPITKDSVLRFYLWPLTAWNLNVKSICKSECVPQEDTTCGPWIDCTYEATQSECRDLPHVVRGNDKVWQDNRGRECTWYSSGRKCTLDGKSYVPTGGVPAVVACCVCGGGERQNANIVRLRMPNEMDPAFGAQVIHTIKVVGVEPVTKRGFFATRWGAQLTDNKDKHPQYVLTTGAYIAKAPDEGSYTTISTLLQKETWGNTRPFCADEELNDFYMRLVMPLTLFGTANYGNPSGASITIKLPEGYQCKYVHPAGPRGGGDDAVPLPILPEDPPNGNGALPDSTTGQGNSLGLNASAIIIGVPSGQWEFKENLCIFHFAPYMVLYGGQYIYMHIFAKNPMFPMPYEDPRNFWTVNFTSRGDAFNPRGYDLEQPCKGLSRYNPPYCNDTGESYFINPIGVPQSTREFKPLYPDAKELERVAGSYKVKDHDGKESNRTWTDRFVVMGRLKQIIAQPVDFHLGAVTDFQIWFVPDLGSFRGGILSVEFPGGFVVPNPCNARDLPHGYYQRYAAPFPEAQPRSPVLSNTSLAYAMFPRIWPLDGIQSCVHLTRYGITRSNTAAIAVRGAMVTGRRYGFQIGVTNPVKYNPFQHADFYFRFKLFIRDAKGRPRDGTYTTAVFDPYTTAPFVEFGDPMRLYAVGVHRPIYIAVDEMRPFAFTKQSTYVSILNITFAAHVRGRLRVTAPPGYIWDWASNAQFQYGSLPGQTQPMPGGVPPKALLAKPNVIEWTGADLYEAHERYAFRTQIRIPYVPARKSGDKFFFEWGVNETHVSDHQNASLFGRSAAASVVGEPVRALRGFKVEQATTIEEEEGALWFWFETVTPVLPNGSIDILVPEKKHPMEFENIVTWDDAGGKFCNVFHVKEFFSDALPADFQCRRVKFPNAMLPDFTPYLEVRIELSCPKGGIPPGRYVIEFAVKNPKAGKQFGKNTVAKDHPCGRMNCWTMYSMVKRYETVLDVKEEWKTQMTPFPKFYMEQNDYWTSIPALRITKRMKHCEIVDMPSPDFLDIRLAIGRNDRPGQRSAIVIAFMLDEYYSDPGDTLDIRAPFGFLFDSICDFYVNEEVYPIAPGCKGMPETYQPVNQSTVYPVTKWPKMAPPQKCRGEGHNARIWFGRGLQPKRLYMFRITIQRTPILTPLRNTWMVAYGGESSGHMPGYPVWTFPASYLDPINLAWTEKPKPQESPVILFYQPTNFIQAWVPPLAPTTTIQPLLRIIAPPLYEFLVDAPDQDIQGGDCFVIIQQVGGCRTCGAPFPKTSLQCRREWNRKNVALIRLLGDTYLMKFTWYSIAIKLFNPHIVDAFEGVARTWCLESFLGDPYPVWQPYGYEIDYIDVPGFKISKKAELTVEPAKDRNGSAYVPLKQFSVQFTDALEIGDTWVLRAPLGYVSTRVIRGLIDRVVCLGFEYNRPAEYRNEKLWDGNETAVLPPWRPPIPDFVPVWANNSARIEDAEAANVSDINGTMWELYNFTVLRPYCLTDRWRETNVTENASNMIGNGFDWLNPPEGTVLNLTVNRDINQTLFPDMVELCLHATWFQNTENFTTMYGPDGCDACCDATWRPPLMSQANCCNASNESNFSNFFGGFFNGNNSSNASLNASNTSESNETCMEPEKYYTQLCSLHMGDEVPPGAEVMSFRVVPNPHQHLHPDLRTGRGIEPDTRGWIPFGAFDAGEIGEEPPHWASRVSSMRRLDEHASANGSAVANDAAANGAAASGSGAAANENGAVAKGKGAAANSSASGANATAKMTTTMAPGSTTTTMNLSNTTTTTPPTTTTTTTSYTGPAPCIGGIAVEIFFATSVNLTTSMEEHTEKRQAALELENWDKYPIQGRPFCKGREWIWTIKKEEIHPEGPKMLNGTRLWFRVAYQNPRRPPLYHENFWTARHMSVTTDVGPFANQLQLSSSAAVPAWTIISKLRWIRIELLSEVLRPDDTGQIHFEFVTVNLATRIKIIAHTPFGFDFKDAFMSSPFSETTTTSTTTLFGGRRLGRGSYDQADMGAEVAMGSAPLQLDKESPLDDFDFYDVAGGSESRQLVSTSPAGNQSRRLKTRSLQFRTTTTEVPAAGKSALSFSTPYTWKGYTRGIEVIRASGNTVELSCNLARVEYTRFRISGIKIPWIGGQSYFDIYTTMREDDADSMLNCCPPGYPANNPGYSFLVPYRMSPIITQIRNVFQQSKHIYPIMGQWETRFNEICRASFEFQIPHPHQPRVDGGLIVLVVRAPPGYEIHDQYFVVEDATGCKKERPDDVCGLSPRVSQLVRHKKRRIELALPDIKVMRANFVYKVTLSVLTPVSLYDRDGADSHTALWVLELNDAFALGKGWVSSTYGSPSDFVLNNSVNITFVAPDTPPDVVVPVDVTFKDAGEIPPTMIQVYAPIGYTFMPNCMAPGQNDLSAHFVSCRERWSLFGATYLSGAVMMTLESAVRRDNLPVTVRLLVKTPEITPADNKWFCRVQVRTGPTAWGFESNPFPVRPMEGGIAFTAIAGTRVSLFLGVFFRYPLPWGGHVHLSAPKTYKLFCPITKVLSGLGGQAPMCSEDDPLLAGCWGLPDAVSGKRLGIPNCDPRHEILLTFPLPSTTTTTTALPLSTKPWWERGPDLYGPGATTVQTTTVTTQKLDPYALPAGSSMLLALDAEVPLVTPTPRSENIFRIRVLDASKTSLDGKLNTYGDQVRQVPVVNDFRLWWTTSVPNTVATIVMEFYFNNSRGDLWRADEIVRVVDIIAPEGLTMAIRRPSDIKNLADEAVSVPVANWSWSPIMPRHVWFTLDPDPEKQNFTGRFHFSFPVLTPSKEVGMPLNNLWQIKLCGDQPYCIEMVLNIPIPGFFFGETPAFELDATTIDRLTGSFGIRAEPTWYCSAGLLICLALRWFFVASAGWG